MLPTGLRPMLFHGPSLPPVDSVPKAILPARLPSFPDYRWPAFLQGIIDCGNSPLTGYPAAAGCSNRAGKHPQQTGKFCVRTKAQVSLSASVRHRASRFRQRCADLGTPFGRTHTQRCWTPTGKNKDHRMEKTKWDTLGRKR